VISLIWLVDNTDICEFVNEAISALETLEKSTTFRTVLESEEIVAIMDSLVNQSAPIEIS
jgi:hypothetical protein